MGRQLTEFLGCPFQVKRSDGHHPFFKFRFLRYFHVTLLYPWHDKLDWLLFHLSNIFYSTNGWTADLSLSTGRSEKKWWTLSLFHIQISQIPTARPPLMTPALDGVPLWSDSVHEWSQIRCSHTLQVIKGWLMKVKGYVERKWSEQQERRFDWH